MRSAVRAAFAPAMLAAAVVLASVRYAPPAPSGLEAPETQFSAARALQHVAAIARAPHPVGSRSHDEVRDLILSRLTALGLEAQLMPALVVLAPRPILARVQNI